MHILKANKVRLIINLLLLCPLLAGAVEVPISLFPVEHYNQDVDHWLPPDAANYKTPLVSAQYQQQRLQNLYRHVFSAAQDGLSPWSKQFVTTLLSGDTPVFNMLQANLGDYGPQTDAEKIGYAENFHPYPASWIQRIADNIDIQQYAKPMPYKASQRGIIVRNTNARMLPTNDPHFNHFTLPGQGYPFDNLQASALWAGTPVYILGETKDHAWSLVMTPSFNAWVESDAIATVTPAFVYYWNRHAQKKLVAITQTQAPILDATNQQYRLSAYVGSIFPLLSQRRTFFKIMIPIKGVNGHAYIRAAYVARDNARIMPLPATRENIAYLLKTLKNRPYGWGGMYFYNDCSQEMQAIFTPLGIWLPRNSSQQVQGGKVVDMSNQSMQQRLDYLRDNGHPLMTTVYIGGHVFLYLGNYSEPIVDSKPIMMTYQNVWGISPKDKSQRMVIGQAAFLPLLSSYPKNPNLISLADRKFFKVIYLDEMPDPAQSFIQDFYSPPSS